MSDHPLVVYYRVSTEQQKRSGLGLLAQQDLARATSTQIPDVSSRS